VDPAQVTASFNDGVLELTVPKPVVKEVEKKKIEIK
jgi:HSP20 family molecular chaperone IbpA